MQQVSYAVQMLFIAFANKTIHLCFITRFFYASTPEDVKMDCLDSLHFFTKSEIITIQDMFWIHVLVPPLDGTRRVHANKNH